MDKLQPFADGNDHAGSALVGTLLRTEGLTEKSGPE